MKKIIIPILMLVFIIPSLVQAINVITYTPIQTFPNQMVGGSTYIAKYRLNNNDVVDLPIYFTFNITRLIPFDWSEFTLSASMNSLTLQCSQVSLGNWECRNNTDNFIFPKQSEGILTLGLSLNLATSPSKFSYVFKVVGPSEVNTTKSFTLDKIVASAFDFSTNSITNLNDITIDRLEYGRADAYVTQVFIIPLSKTFIGTLKFAARGTEKGSLFTVTVSSEGLLNCSDFSNKKLNCTAKGRLTGGTTLHPGLIDLSEFRFVADKDADTISVYAKDTHGKTVLDAKVEDWSHRVPQLPISFVYYGSTF